MTLLFCFLSSLFPFFLFTVFVPLLVFLSSFYPLALTKHTQTHSTPAISSHLQPLSHGHTHTLCLSHTQSYLPGHTHTGSWLDIPSSVLVRDWFLCLVMCGNCAHDCSLVSRNLYEHSPNVILSVYLLYCLHKHFFDFVSINYIVFLPMVVWIDLGIGCNGVWTGWLKHISVYHWTVSPLRWPLIMCYKMTSIYNIILP